MRRIASVLIAGAFLTAACGGGTTREPIGACVDAVGRCTVPEDAVTSDEQCAAEYGAGYAARVCETGTGADCYQLDEFGTDATCSGVTVSCCPAPPVPAQDWTTRRCTADWCADAECPPDRWCILCDAGIELEGTGCVDLGITSCDGFAFRWSCPN